MAESMQEWAEVAHRQGHALRVAIAHYSGREQPDEVLRILFCAKCGTWATAAQQQKCQLLGPCHNEPTRAGADVLSRLRRGLHPKAGLTPPLATVLCSR